MALVAGDLGHIGADLVLDPVAARLVVAAFKVGDYTLKGLLIGSAAVDRLAVDRQLFVTGSVEDNIYHVVGNVFERLAERKIVFFGKCFKIHRSDRAALHCPSAALDAAVAYAFILVGNYFVLVDFEEHA